MISPPNEAQLYAKLRNISNEKIAGHRTPGITLNKTRQDFEINVHALIGCV